MSLVGMVEDACGRYGELVADYPIRAAGLCLTIVAFSSIGLMNLTRELRTYKLWVSQDSEYIKVNF